MMKETWFRGALRVGVEFGMRWGNVSGGEPLFDEGKIVGALYLNAALGRHFVRISVGIDWNARHMFSTSEFSNTDWKAPSAFAEVCDRGLQIRHVFIDLDGAQVFYRVLPDIGFLGGIVGRAPQHPRRGVIPSVFVHHGRQEL